jgi:Domain of unknown function (DUF4926)
MREPHIDDFVRLTQDVPQFALNKGEVGVVRSTWFAPSHTYEVEFHQIGHDYQTRCLLSAEQVVLEEDPAGQGVNAGDDATNEYVSPT